LFWGICSFTSSRFDWAFLGGGVMVLFWLNRSLLDHFFLYFGLNHALLLQFGQYNSNPWKMGHSFVCIIAYANSLPNPVFHISTAVNSPKVLRETMKGSLPTPTTTGRGSNWQSILPMAIVDGKLKRQRGFTFTLMKGKEKVFGEVGLEFIGYNPDVRRDRL